MACGELNLDINYFYKLTPRQFDNILEGYRCKEEASIKLKYELNRDLEWAIMSPYLDEKNPKHPKTIIEYKCFPWEKQKEVLAITKTKTKAEQQAFWENVDKNKEK